MAALSAPDAIRPAITRTANLLFRPFRLGTFLKLCLVATVTECSGGGFNVNVPAGHATNHSQFVPSTQAFASPFHFTPALIAGIAVFSLAMIVIGCLLFYLITRLRFAFFHCLIHNTREIRPGWHLYRVQSKRFFWLSLAVGFGILLLAALMVLPFVLSLIRLTHAQSSGGHATAMAFLPFVLVFLLVVLAMILVCAVVEIVLRDLMMPHIALDNATAAEAWAAVWTRIRTEKGAFCLYGVLRVLLPIVAVFAMAIATIFLVILLGLTFGLTVYAIHLGTAHATGLPSACGITAEIAVGAVGVTLLILAGLSLAGPVFTGIREYALVFYGGRYAKLGAILDPPPQTGLSAEPASSL